MTAGDLMRWYGMSSPSHSELTGRIIGAAIAVQRELGPGLLESAYETCLEIVLKDLGLRVDRQLALSVRFRDVTVDPAYRIDLLVDRKVVVEIKAVDRLLPEHTAQVLTYLRFSHLHVGLVINFHSVPLKNGIKRVVL